MRFLLFAFLVTGTCVAQEQFSINGTVLDARSGERLSAANIRAAGTSRGTVANADGVFRLMLPPGKHALIISSLAYVPDTLALDLSSNVTRVFTLLPAEIILPEVVVTSEDPAVEIMRRVIAAKKKWAERLSSYEMDAFTRQVLKRDTAIASITESFTKGYWQKGDTLREIVKQKRQTENVTSEFNLASVGRILNFYDDEIRFIGYTFAGPTASDAFEYYDFTLTKTRVSFGKEVFEIAVKPRSRTTPLFEGTLSVAGDSYALVGVDVEPNTAFTIPFVKEKSLRYRQQFALYENSYWMPVDIRIDARVSIGIAVIRIPPIGFSQTSVISNYAINVELPDTIFTKPRLSVDALTAATFDSVFWRTNAVLPLTLEETHAYETLDSTQTLKVQFRRGGFSIGIGGGDNSSFDALRHADVFFNRVEGFHGGVKPELDDLIKLATFDVGLAYGFSDKRWKYNLGATVFTSSGRTIGIGAEVYRRVAHREDAGYYGTSFNTLTSLLAKNDYFDHFEAEGWRAFLTLEPSKNIQGKIAFIAEDHRHVEQNSNFSFFARGRSYRRNPQIEAGASRSVRMDLRFGEKAVPLEFVRINSWELHADFTMKEGRSDFDFPRVWTTATVGIPTFSRSLLFPQTAWLRISAGTSSKDTPPQYIFDLESASSNYAPFGVFRAMDVKEFSGRSFVALTVEHNFRSVPFLALGIPFLYENNIEFIVHGGVARSWSEARWYPNLPATANPLFPRMMGNPTGGWYSEVGFGFGKIVDVLRADFTWRLSAPTRFRFTLGVASLL